MSAYNCKDCGGRGSIELFDCKCCDGLGSHFDKVVCLSEDPEPICRGVKQAPEGGKDEKPA